MNKVMQWTYYLLSIISIGYVIASYDIAVNLISILVTTSIVVVSLNEYRKTNAPYYKVFVETLLFFFLVVIMPNKWLFKETKRKVRH